MKMAQRRSGGPHGPDDSWKLRVIQFGLLVSAVDMDRPALWELMADIRAGRVDWARGNHRQAAVDRLFAQWESDPLRSARCVRCTPGARPPCIPAARSIRPSSHRRDRGHFCAASGPGYADTRTYSEPSLDCRPHLP